MYHRIVILDMRKGYISRFSKSPQYSINHHTFHEIDVDDMLDFMKVYYKKIVYFEDLHPYTKEDFIINERIAEDYTEYTLTTKDRPDAAILQCVVYQSLDKLKDMHKKNVQRLLDNNRYLQEYLKLPEPFITSVIEP